MNRLVGAAMPLLAVAVLTCFGVSASWAQEVTPSSGARHEVRRGDTLWDLAGRYLANPYRWSDIYRLNQDVVQDPHWIYPGERLRIPGEGLRSAARVTGLPRTPAGRAGRPEPATNLSNTVFGERADQLLSLSTVQVDEAARPSIVSPSDYYQASLLLAASELEPMGRTVRVVEENPLELDLPPSARLHQDVIVHVPGMSVEPDDLLQTIRWERTISPHGTVAVSKALLLVTRVSGDSARARVVEVFGDYAVDDPVVAAAEFSLDPDATPSPTETEVTGTIIAFAVRNQNLLDMYDEVFLDLGRREGIRVGDEFLVFSHLERSPGRALPEDALSMIRVVRVTGSTATAVVTSIRDPGTREGNPVRLFRRLGG